MRSRLLHPVLILCAAGLFSMPPSALATSRTAVWAARFDGPASQDDEAAAVAVSPDGTRVFTTGSAQNLQGDDDFTTIAYTATTGSEVWTAIYDGPVGFDQAKDVAVSPDGAQVFATGTSDGGDTDWATVAYDAASGAQLWVARFDSGHDQDIPYAVAVSPDGGSVFVTGSAAGDTLFTAAYDAATGSPQWQAMLIEGFQFSTAVAVAVSPDGTKVFITGYGYTGLTQEAITIGYDAATGGQLWIARYDTTDDDVANSLTLSSSGNRVFITGFTQPVNTVELDTLTIAYDAITGQQLWTASYDSGLDTRDEARSIGAHPTHGSVFVTGSQDDNASSQEDIFTIAYDQATGDQLWLSTYDGPAHSTDSAYALSVLPVTGTFVYVTGTSVSQGTGFDLLILAYRAGTGGVAWGLKYNGARQGSDIGVDVSASASARMVFSVGSSRGIGTHGDFVTIGRSA